MKSRNKFRVYFLSLLAAGAMLFAPTLAAVLGVKAPSGARGSALEEVVHAVEE